MLVTLTPNPSVDRTLQIPELRRGAVLRATSQRIDPGGKGVNVARALIAVDGRAVAVLPLQLLAYRIAVPRDLNVDRPRNLANTVTVE